MADNVFTDKKYGNVRVISVNINGTLHMPEDIASFTRPSANLSSTTAGAWEFEFRDGTIIYATGEITVMCVKVPKKAEAT